MFACMRLEDLTSPDGPASRHGRCPTLGGPLGISDSLSVRNNAGLNGCLIPAVLRQSTVIWATLSVQTTVFLDGGIGDDAEPFNRLQEALADATYKLGNYARERPLPFYPWLHRL